MLEGTMSASDASLICSYWGKPLKPLFLHSATYIASEVNTPRLKATLFCHSILQLIFNKHLLNVFYVPDTKCCGYKRRLKTPSVTELKNQVLKSQCHRN